MIEYYHLDLEMESLVPETNPVVPQLWTVSTQYCYAAVKSVQIRRAEECQTSLGLQNSHFWERLAHLSLPDLVRSWVSWLLFHEARRDRGDQCYALYIVCKGAPAICAKIGNS